MPSDAPQPGGPDAEVCAIVDRAASGDEDAWRDLVDRYARRLFALFRSRGCDPERAEELTQSVFVSVARVLGEGRYNERGRFEPWLFRIAVNRLRDDARKRRRSATHQPPEALEAAAGRPAPADDGAAGLWRALGGLGEADREVIELRHRADMSFKQIAEMLGQPLGTVLARHHRALRKLRTLLEQADAQGTATRNAAAARVADA